MAMQTPIKAKMPRHKAVRFALQGLDGETYRTLADLREAETAPLEYLYALHCDGTLERWLAQQHCTEEVNALRDLPKEQVREEHLHTLAGILYPGVELDINALVRHWKMAELWKEQHGEAVDRQENYANAVGLYHRGFRDLCQALIDDAWDMPALKEHLIRLENEYLPLMRLALWDFMTFLMEHSVGCVLLLLAKRSFRKLLDEGYFLYEDCEYDYTAFFTGVLDDQRKGLQSEENSRLLKREGANKIITWCNVMDSPLNTDKDGTHPKVGDFLDGMPDVPGKVKSLVRVKYAGEEDAEEEDADIIFGSKIWVTLETDIIFGSETWETLETADKEYMYISTNLPTDSCVRPCEGKPAGKYGFYRGLEAQKYSHGKVSVYYMEVF